MGGDTKRSGMVVGTLEQCLKGCWGECGKKCIVDEDEIEIVGPLRQFSSGSGWVPGWMSRTGSALCTPRRHTDSVAPAAFSDAFSGSHGTGGYLNSGACTGPAPTPRSSGFNSHPRSNAGSRLASRHLTPRA
mmetsp:Transcript_86646/g.220717  ORF Transcript_86646/g.220717 Transcript_86646/m.220717 type:complete len:132 (+) Transcript_86646:74-469(+)